MSDPKLVVEVVSAHDLMPKDGQGSSNAFVELQFDGQKAHTTTKDKDLNPVWNETFDFNISDPSNLSNLALDACVYNHNGTTKSNSFLGKVCLTGRSFVPYSDAVVLHYPLEKRSIFFRVKGELGLKVFVTGDLSIRSSNPLPAMESSTHSDLRSTNSQALEQFPSLSSDSSSDDEDQGRHTSYYLPNANISQQQQHSYTAATQPSMNYGAYKMKSEPQASKIVHTSSGLSSQPTDCALKETSPFLGGGQVIGGRVVRGDWRAGPYDLVEQMRLLFVRVLKARDLPSKDVTGSPDPFVVVKVGNYKGITKYYEKKQNPEWNVVFAFAWERLQSSVLEVVVKDKDMANDDFVGLVRFELNEVPTRVSPDSPLASEWYHLEDGKGEKKKGELMLAVWYGTQADEAFPDAWHSDAVTPTDSSSNVSAHIRSKVYHSPSLWYVRVNVVEAKDLVISDNNRFPDAYVKVEVGNQVLKTKSVQSGTLNPVWNEDMMFVAAEPFEDHLILTVEDRVGPDKDETIGKVVIPLHSVEKRTDDRIVHTRWFNLEKSVSSALDGDNAKKDKFSGRLHLRVCLDGGYHVLDDSTDYSSDLRPTAKQLWKPAIGVLELGILKADGLHPMKTRDGIGRSDTYCVAKYGRKWVRTRSIINSLSPKYNEQYTWEVYDPTTLFTVGVFDNSHINPSGSKDMKIGKVRIRISTLETGRVYTHAYPLLVLHPSGVKKMGELHLAIRFSYTSFANMMFLYSRPLFPKMHYVRPLAVAQRDMLRHHAVNIVAARLSRAEPPLGKEVVEYMSEVDSHLWSLRRSKANFFRLMSVFSVLFALRKWFEEVCLWRNPITTVLVHLLFVMLVCFPQLILPAVFLYFFMIGLWNYRYRPRHPPHVDTRISYGDTVHPDELDEEFDSFPTTRSSDIVRMRYDRLRSVAGRVQTVVGDVATQGERIQALLGWRDPRVTSIFAVFCLAAAVVLYVTPFRVLALLAGWYIMRHPRFRRKIPSAPINFFIRLPAKADSLF